MNFRSPPQVTLYLLLLLLTCKLRLWFPLHEEANLICYLQDSESLTPSNMYMGACRVCTLGNPSACMVYVYGVSFCMFHFTTEVGVIQAP